jgi:uncharacterized protein YndB with AHSA1/START domain
MLKKIAILVAVVIGAILILAATKPNTFHAERTTSIKAPAEKIFPLINDFHNWPAWSPYEKLDPNMKRTLSGAPGGKGAVYEWAGNSEAGVGRMEILDSTPGKITIKLDFIKPFEGHNIAEFTLEPQADSTIVTWSLSGPSPYFLKLMTVFMNLDKAIGKDFESGLANLKAVAEK